MAAPHADLLARFVAAFQRGIRDEIASMREQASAFEIPLAGGQALGADERRRVSRYSFALGAPADKVVIGGELVLRTPMGEQLVTIDLLDEARVTLAARQEIDPGAGPIALVIAPWFLYDRLIGALGELDPARHGVARALTLFGKLAPTRAEVPLRLDHGALNRSQRAAVQLCSDSDLAFVWGPPGTGKTTTLAHVIEELRAQGKRILLVSTTNAALDQVLAKLASRPSFAEMRDRGDVVRLGRSDGETFGAELAEVVRRGAGDHHRAVERLRARLADAERIIAHGESLRTTLAAAIAPQRSLFGEPPARLDPNALAALVPLPVARRLANEPPAAQAAAVERRLARFRRLASLCKARIASHGRALQDGQAQVVARAPLVLATLTNAYLSPLVKDLRFDVVIAEEASMAVLPNLFYAACLAGEKTIVVGDPRQLPPIVHSTRDGVHQVLGRNVFDVTVPDPAASEVVALLDTQYRMHATIGALVGDLFYERRLIHGGAADALAAITLAPPYPGAAVVVVDTGGRTTCVRAASGSSRVNAESAALCARLALDAAGDGGRSVAVITPYTAQAREIRRRLGRAGDGAIECSTIHRFQGHECDVVILDTVDAAPMRPGLLLSGEGARSVARNLLNVSISRARGKLIIVADVAYVERELAGGVLATLLRAALVVGRHEPMS